jgi:ribosomal protein S27E
MMQRSEHTSASTEARSGLSLLSPFTWLRGIGRALWRDRFAADAPPTPRAVLPYMRYRERRKALPNTFTTDDWTRALEYWGNTCAVCGRPPGLWHTLSQDHWLPLSHSDCPGTVAMNMLPLCYGVDGCNNSKGKKHPRKWLIERLGSRKGRKKIAEIEAYFAWVQDQIAVTCPDCDGELVFLEPERIWRCLECGVDWRESEA